MSDLTPARDTTTQVKLVIAPTMFTAFPKSIHKFFLVKT
jgi:hypothetical protein